jgi:hypothetical protein
MSNARRPSAFARVIWRPPPEVDHGASQATSLQVVIDVPEQGVELGLSGD